MQEFKTCIFSFMVVEDICEAHSNGSQVLAWMEIASLHLRLEVFYCLEDLC